MQFVLPMNHSSRTAESRFTTAPRPTMARVAPSNGHAISGGINATPPWKADVPFTTMATKSCVRPASTMTWSRRSRLGHRGNEIFKVSMSQQSVGRRICLVCYVRFWGQSRQYFDGTGDPDTAKAVEELFSGRRNFDSNGMNEAVCKACLHH